MSEDTTHEIHIVDFPATRLLCLEHVGDPRHIGDTIRTFVAWRKAQQLPPSTHATFNLAHTGLTDTPPEQFRFDIGVATDRAPVGDGIVAKTIPAGRCAVLRHIGSDDRLGHAIRRLYAEWLPASGEALRDFPLFFQRVRFFPDVPEHEAITDIFLPLR